MPDVSLDVTNLLCPLPVLKTKKAIDSIQSGQNLEVIANNTAAKSDIIYLVQRLELELTDVSEADSIIRITIKK
ncbi:MAG: sulfurtransferase TusA family protein [Nitrospirota bacterium]|nr:sulfurtransferase TusA family protein [Nitrospirota bacterium]